MYNRRCLCGFLGALAVSGHIGTAAAAGRRTFVLVHGSWHGGWCWDAVVKSLAQRGHRVFAPTLTGLGERRHLLSKDVNLTTHITDVCNVIETEDLSDAVLVGHSYGGIVISGVADRMPPRLSQLIYLDALLVDPGQTVFSTFFSPEEREAVLKVVAEQGNGVGIPPLPASLFGITDPEKLQWVQRHLSPQPVGTYEEPLQLQSELGGTLRKTYIECTQNALPVIEPIRKRVRADSSWRVRTLDSGHDAMVSAPERLTKLLVEIAG